MEPTSNASDRVEWDVIAGGRKITLHHRVGSARISAYVIDANTDLLFWLPEDEAMGWAHFFSAELPDGSRPWACEETPTLLDRLLALLGVRPSRYHRRG